MNPTSRPPAFKPLALVAALLGAACLQAVAQTAAFDIPSQPLADALRQFARQAGVQLVFAPEMGAGRRSRPVQGTQDARAALRQLLLGTGLELRQDGATWTVAPVVNSGATLAEVRVTAQAEQDATTEGRSSYAARGATLFKGAQSLKDIPQSITVITRAQMDDQGLDTLDEVLANTPGVTLRRRPGGGSDILTRGFETNTLQYDGVPLPRSYTNGNMRASNTAHLDRVEVLRGAQGLLEGAGSPAGAVNLVRKRGLADAAFSVQGRLGSWDHYGTRVDAGGPLNAQGTLRGRAVLDYDRRHSFIDKVQDRDLNAYLALDLDLSADTTVGLGVAHSRMDGNSGMYGGQPRYANGTALPLPRSANMDAEWSGALRRETQVFADLTHRFNADWTLKATAVHGDESYDGSTALSYFRLIPLGGRTLSAPGFVYDFAARNKGLDVHVQGKFRALGMAHEVVAGLSYSDQNRGDAFDEYANTQLDVFQSQLPIARIESRAFSRTRDLSYRATQKGVYGLWRAHLTDRATVLLGARASDYRMASTIVNPLTRATVSSTRQGEHGEFTPYAGLVYAFTPQWSAYASYAEIFEPQSVTDARLTVLPPMSGVNHEAGVKGELLDGGLQASLALYRIEQRNRAVTDYSAPAVCGSNGSSYCSRAAGKVRSDGVDLELRGRLTPAWQVSAGYTYGRNQYLDDQNAALIGTPFDYESPRHILRVWSDYRLPGEWGAWRVGGGVNYRSQQRTDSATLLNPVQGGYAVWSARVDYRINRHWSAALNVENVFDKRYWYSIANNYLNSYVGTPRNLLLTVRGEF